MGAGDNAELLWCGDPCKTHELLQIVLVSAAGLRVVKVDEPSGRGRNVGQLLKLECR